jgi:predicted P-loop ATPase
MVPLLISDQGFGKSTFCRQLLPPELRWGYMDSLLLSEKKQVLQAMSQMLLINLDEFNQISRKLQEGFLKNIIQLPVVMARRPYGRRVEELPRKASFIATTNMTDVLTDVSGNRRFMAIELTRPIDTVSMPEPRQLYAQILDSLERGERYWFDDEETKLLIRHNHRYEQQSSAELYFAEIFKAVSDEKEGQWLTATAIFDKLRHVAGAAIPANSLTSFGRMLTHMDGLRHRRSSSGSFYLVAMK